MKTLVAAFVFLCAASSPAGGPPPSPGAEATDTTRLGVKALLHEWGAASAEGRWEDLKTTYAEDPDFFWIETGRVAYQDHAAVIAGVDRVAAMNASIKTEIRDIVVTPLSADAAAFRAMVSVAFVAPDYSFDFDGAFSGVAISRDRRWRFLQGHLPKADAAAAN